MIGTMVPCQFCYNRSEEDRKKCKAYPQGIPDSIWHNHPGVKKPCNPEKPDIKWEVEEEYSSEKEELVKLLFLKY